MRIVIPSERSESRDLGLFSTLLLFSHSITINSEFLKVRTMDVLAAFLSDVDPGGIPLAAVSGVVLICLYYIAAWLMAGRDPAPGPIVVHYDPPRGISPALMRYLLKKGFDEKCFTSALLNMAAKGYVQFEPQPGGYQINRGPASDSALSEDERVLGTLLLGRGFNLRLNADHRERI